MNASIDEINGTNRARRSFHCPQESPCAETATTSLCILVSSPDLDDVSDHGRSPQIRSAAMSQLFVTAQFERKGQMHASERTWKHGASSRGGASRISWSITPIEPQLERIVSIRTDKTHQSLTDGHVVPRLHSNTAGPGLRCSQITLATAFFHIPHFGIQACAK